ncbi:MAG: hypothetical protein JSS49_17925 [Planctomycetes bacterium]|nr:hypothetical protein [Planctomycetota bacterium]
MDERKIDAPPLQSVAPQEHPYSDSSRSLSLNGSELRIDPPHVSTNIGGVAPTQVTAPAPFAAPTPRANSQLLLEAGRILEQLQIQDADLNQRQANLEEQIAAFEAERQSFQERRAADEGLLEERRRTLAADEADLRQRLAETQELLAQIEAARSAVEQDRISVDHQRTTLRQELLDELQHDRQELALEHERARALSASLEEQLRLTTAEAEKLIQGERERLWQTLILEWEERRVQFQRDHDSWLATVQAEKVEIEREKAFYEAAVRNAETDFAAARLAQDAELQSLREEQIAALQAERAQLQEAIRAEKQDWERTLAEQQAQLRAAYADESSALQLERDRLVESLESVRADLQIEQDEWNKARSAQLAELQGERAVLENRIRFQQEHLEKLRADLERAQNEHRKDRQVERQRMEDDSRQIIRRMRQIDLYRSSIDEREKSLEREREVLEKSRRAFSSSVDLDRLNLQREQSAWQAERQIQQSELLKQQELYSTHAESLESRRIRLEKLRTELEDTHRSTLEMRLAVEEAWVELTQAAGQEAARERVEQVRNTLVGYYRQLHEGLVEQRREHLESQSKFERLRADFHDERQKLMEWISTRDQELRVGEERLRLAAADAANRDSAWQSARNRWMQEKAEAEQVIRKLLGELGNQHRDPAMGLPSDIPMLAGLSSIPGSLTDSIGTID